MRLVETIEGVAQCTFIVFQKDDFTIAKFRPIDKEGMPHSDFSMKGNMTVKVGREYTVKATVDKKTSYKNSYDMDMIKGNYDLKNGSRKDLITFLESVTTHTRATNLVDTLPNLIDVLEAKDIDKLIEVKGIGFDSANKILNEYDNQKDYSEAFVKLKKFDLTKGAIAKICKHFGSADTAINKMSENPYCLVEVDGFGFTSADSAFLANSKENSPTDRRRVEAYIDYMFEALEDEGHTWLEARQFIAKVKKYIPTADLKYAVNYVKSSDKFFVEEIDDKKYRITSKEFYDMEMNIAKELNRLMVNKCTMDLTGYESSIKLTEGVNGWEYNDEQVKAIEGMIANNVYMLQGLAGTGKSSTVKAFLNAVEASGYSYSQSALSGKASDNLTKVTGKQGYTIHSLLGAGASEVSYFKYNSKNKLFSNVVVLDELSMVNSRIFLSLIEAIPSGSKLIMIGDFGQLEAIGIGVMGGLIRSKSIPMSLLKKINRQAKGSAIITHSISIRNGIVPEDLDIKAGNQKTYGEREDLEYIMVDNSKERDIFHHTIKEFKKAINKYDIEDVQIICSTKTTGAVSTYELNLEAQNIHNPYKVGDIQVELGIKGQQYNLRVGDKIINMRNNNKTKSLDGMDRPIYNGNTGIINNITNDEVTGDTTLVIDFDGIGEVVVAGKENTQNIQLGYAITCHKSQGSTIKYVILALPFHYLLNTREFLYTGMTRASEHLTLITSPKSFQRAIKNTSVKTKQIMLDEFIKKTLKKKEA